MDTSKYTKTSQCKRKHIIDDQCKNKRPQSFVDGNRNNIPIVKGVAGDSQRISHDNNFLAASCSADNHGFIQRREACRMNRQRRAKKFSRQRSLEKSLGKDACRSRRSRNVRHEIRTRQNMRHEIRSRQLNNMRVNFGSNISSIPDQNVVLSSTVHRGPRKQRPRYTPWSFGRPTYVCSNCEARLWYEERIRKNRSSTNPNFSICCQDGKVQLPRYRKCPNYLWNLLHYSGGPDSKKFRQNIRMYNSIFAFTSMGGHIDNSINNGRGPYIFRINGQNHHRIGSLLPQSNQPKFAQLYIYDTENEVSNRMKAHGISARDKLDEEIVQKLKSMFDEHNEIAKVFRMARDRFTESNMQHVSLRLLETRSRDGRQYNLPTSNEIAGLIDATNSASCGYRDIVIEEQSGLLRRINEKHPSFMAMQYPLLFPYGEDGYRRNIKYKSGVVDRQNKRTTVTMREYYAYLLQYRDDDGNTLIRGGKVFQQFVVDAYTCIEEERLNWVRGNQSNIRSEVYRGLKDAITAGDTSAISIGKRIILPSSFTGGPRYMVQSYQDAMAICRWAGSPDFFVTFTCNPKWVEIKEGLEFIAGQRAEDRPDIVSRVFNIKL